VSASGIRATGSSPHREPGAILALPGILRRMTGKRLEIPIKRILLGVFAEYTHT
jgi:hypothetical protein